MRRKDRFRKHLEDKKLNNINNLNGTRIRSRTSVETRTVLYKRI